MELVRTEFCELYCGDCRELLPTLAAGSVDAVVTDPPYGIGFGYSTHDDCEQNYDSLILPVISELNRISPKCSFVWQAMNNASKWHKWFPEEYRIFAACKGFVQFRPTPVQYSWDPIIWWGNPSCEPSVYRKDFHEQRTAPFGFKRQRIDHPCPRPLEQVEYIVDLASQEGDTILDPFMGSGTTGVACVRTGRRFIGCEIDKRYFDIAVRRIQEAEGKGSLFDAERMKQESDLFVECT